MTTDADIKRKRAELEEEEKRVSQQWKGYDLRYPVVVGAYKPDDYDAKQRYFFDQLSQVRHRLRALPRTTGETIARVARTATAIAAGGRALADRQVAHLRPYAHHE